MAYAIDPPVLPMLARLATEIPSGEEWRYEPKWDGFRAIVFRDGGRIHIGSRNGQPLERYFPELVDIFLAQLPERCVVDGEIVIAGGGGLDFDALLQRIHPAASRVRRLAGETPSSFAAFDLLALGEEDLRARPFDERRSQLVRVVESTSRCFVTPQTSDPAEAQAWFDQFEGAGLDGVIAKRGAGPYVAGERVMVKIKHQRTADCVVGGYRTAKNGKGVGSLLLGVYDEEGSLHFVGHTSSFSAAERVRIAELLVPLHADDSFGEGGRAPGRPSRWSRDRDLSWTPLKPGLVCEVAFDHLQSGRFRHATRFLRWRADKRPKECTFDQFVPPRPFSLDEIVALSERDERQGPAT